MFDNPRKPPNEKTIWRYLSIDKYLDLVTTQTIKFTQVDIAADKLEILLMLDRLKRNGSFVGKEDTFKSAEQFIDILRKSHYISCWTGKEHECRSLWFAYLGESRLGVAIKTTVGRFLENIDWAGHGFDYNEIIYRDSFCEPEELQSNILLLNSKALAYSSESEVRFSTTSNSSIQLQEGDFSSSTPPAHININSLPKFISFKANLESMIDEVWLSPYCQEWQLEMLKTVTKKLAPYLADRIKRSDVDERM